MKRLNKKNSVILFSTLIIVGILGLSSFLQKSPKLEKTYQKQVQIFNQIKMEIQPISITNGENISFHISYETFQNTEFLENDLKEITLLEDHLGNPYTPIKWESNQINEHKKTGILTFLTSSAIPKELTLYIYHPNETTYKWSLDNKNNIAQQKDDSIQ